MFQALLIIGLIAIGIIFIIYFNKIQNFVNLISKKIIDDKKFPTKFLKIGLDIFLIIIVIVVCYYLIQYIIDGINSKNVVDAENENKVVIWEKQKEEYEIYERIINQKYEEQQYDNPYIPDGFSYVEGTWNTGFVIEDEKGNQYVWVPCTNEEVEGIPQIKTSDFENYVIMLYECYDTEYDEFLKSACKYGGFYIARYEIGKSESGEPVSKKDQEIWTNLSKEEALELIDNMYDTDKFKIQLMNSYAYDITLKWTGEYVAETEEENENQEENTQEESAESETIFEKIYNKLFNNVEYTEYGLIYDEEEEKYTGREQKYNIYDLNDSIYEMTTEIYFNKNVVVRGRTKSTPEVNRSAFATENLYNVGFRTIIYKE